MKFIQISDKYFNPNVLLHNKNDGVCLEGKRKK